MRKDTSFEKFTFMVVDDDKLTRVTLLRLFKNLGDPEIFCAEDGNIALSMLEQRNDRIDCVLLDFNMPIIHGLQMLKIIRCGNRNIRRNLPVILLTSYGEPVLVKLAIELDANTFILKPLSKNVLVPRLKEILSLDKDDESWIKPLEEYLNIDVDSPIVEILEANAKNQISSKDFYKTETQLSGVTVIQCSIDELKEGQVLARNVIGNNELLYFSERTKITPKILTTLRDLNDMKLISNKVPIIRAD
jgi:two-component system chemotaxis response regulator CheY